jgi:type II secretory pathway predicted ATPase ExeA
MHEKVLAHFGFSRLPFPKHISAKDCFTGRAHSEALARLSFGVLEEELLLLTGPVGCGKSVVLGCFAQSLDANHYSPLVVRGGNLSEAQLYKTILEGLKIEPPFFCGQAKRLFFKLIPELPKKPVIILDDSQDLPEPTLLAVKSMVNFGFDTPPPITFVFAGQPELRETLRYSQFLPLRQRIRISYPMQPMGLEETCSYIDHHTSICGKPTSLFSDDAKAEIHRHTTGIPRRVNTICYQSILRAAANDIAVLDSSNLVYDELSE